MKDKTGNSLVSQWLRLWAFTAKDLSSIPGQWTKKCDNINTIKLKEKAQEILHVLIPDKYPEETTKSLSYKTTSDKHTRDQLY